MPLLKGCHTSHGSMLFAALKKNETVYQGDHRGILIHCIAQLPMSTMQGWSQGEISRPTLLAGNCCWNQDIKCMGVPWQGTGNPPFLHSYKYPSFPHHVRLLQPSVRQDTVLHPLLLFTNMFFAVQPAVVEWHFYHLFAMAGSEH